MTRTKVIALPLVAAALFVGLPIVVHRATGFSEMPVLRGIAWALASAVLYPLAAQVQRNQKKPPLRWSAYMSVNFGIAVFAMSFEGLLAR